MSVKCFVCIKLKQKNPLKVIFSTTCNKLLMKHIKLKHPYTAVYNCIFCPLATTHRYVYSSHIKRHLDRNHVEYNDQIPNIIVPQIPNIVECNVPLENNLQNNDVPGIGINIPFQNNSVNLDTYSNDIKVGACRYVLSLLNNSAITMKNTLQTINTVGSFLSPISHFVRTNINNLETCGNKETFLELCQFPFKHISTEYKLLKYLKSKNLYSKPTKYVLKSTVELRTKKGKTALANVEETVVLMPIKSMIKNILELPGLYEKMMRKMEDLMKDNSNIRNFVQGEKWRNIVRNNPGKRLIPIFLYNDDFAVGNQQGIKANRHGISVVNLHLPLMDDWELSKLEFLFPAAFVKASLTKGGNKTKCLVKLVEVLKDICENGISINVNNEEIVVHIVLGTIIGDNLAIHQMLDFTSGFMHEYMCRVCLMDKKTRNKAVVENKTLFRTFEHYNLNKNNPLYGYIRRCPFNQIPNYHVIENYSADIMHDFFEGVAIFGMQASLDYFTKEGFFSCLEFENWLDSFSYGQIDCNNKLSSDNYKNGKLYLTAMQSMLLIKYLPILICHRVPMTDPTFKYLIVLEKLSDLCMCTNFNEERIQLLINLIKKHHQMYLKFKETKIDPISGESIEKNKVLKPKHHISTHWATCIRKNGPLVYMWAMRHEGLNRYMKIYTYASTSRINLSFSLAKKFLLKFSYFIDYHRNSGFCSLTEYSTSKHFILDTKIYKDNLIFTFPKENIVCSYEKITFKGTEYRIGYFVFISNVCYKIIDIISTKSQNAFVILKEYKFVEKENLNYYILENATDNFQIRTLNYLGLPFNIVTLKNKTKIFKFNRYRIIYN